ncbi:VOC family protein [uncultured Thermanaerothrix sp.]|uniref:VOC family protein n=1 Tax=uncultured Thermanaerothrix sp. TaxID=1195149 RepID=UPI002606668F|nr:VOC family protein [uncultured Thermanaerothrix sp.]
MKTTTPKIIPNLWYDREAREAAEFYVAAFGNGSRLTNITTLHDTPSEDADIVSFTLADQPFMAISGGPPFKFNPAISFIVNFDPARDPQARSHLDALWTKLSAGGTILMPLDRYPFSDHFGWIADRYDLSWQLILSNPAGEERPFITPHLLFVGEVYGKAEEAINFYLSVFKDTTWGSVFRYGEDQVLEKPGTIMFADFMLEGQWFSAADSAYPHEFAFNEAISFIVYCRDQDEIDAYWDKLSAVLEAEQCGWLKDRYGVSWQIVPAEMDEMLRTGMPEQIAQLTQALLPMKKIRIAELREAFYG